MLADSVNVRGFMVLVTFVHCAVHNLNVVVNNAADAIVEGISFYCSKRIHLL